MEVSGLKASEKSELVCFFRACSRQREQEKSKRGAVPCLFYCLLLGVSIRFYFRDVFAANPNNPVQPDAESSSNLLTRKEQWQIVPVRFVPSYQLSNYLAWTLDLVHFHCCGLNFMLLFLIAQAGQHLYISSRSLLASAVFLHHCHNSSATVDC